MRKTRTTYSAHPYQCLLLLLLCLRHESRHNSMPVRRNSKGECHLPPQGHGVHSVVPVPIPWRRNHGHRICTTMPFDTQGKDPLAGQVVDVEYWCSVSIVTRCDIACDVAIVTCVACNSHLSCVGCGPLCNMNDHCMCQRKENGTMQESCQNLFFAGFCQRCFSEPKIWD